MDTSIISYILITVLIVGMVVLMVVQNRRQKRAQDDYMKMLDGLRVGVKVKMASGLLGRIKEIREEAPGFKTVVLATSDDKNATEITFVLEAVQGIVNEEAITRLNMDLAAKVNAQEEEKTVTAPEEPAAAEEKPKTPKKTTKKSK